MVTDEKSLVKIAIERFAEAVNQEEVRRAEHPMTEEKAQALATQLGTTPEHFFEALGIFSDIQDGGFAVGRWGYGTVIFDIKDNVVYKALRGRTPGIVVIYRVPFLGCPGRFESGEGSIGEVLFGSSWKWAAFGGPEAAMQYRLSESEVTALLCEIENRGINLDEYLAD